MAFFYFPTFWHFLSGNGYQLWSGVAGSFIMTSGFFTIYKQHNCKAHWWCPFWAKHPVHGTTFSVCPVHHTSNLHQKLQNIHKKKYSHRLVHGESIHIDTRNPTKTK